MERTMLFICSDKQVKLNNLAGETHVSMAEIERKANDSLQLKAVEEERELEMLTEAVIESNKKAMQSLKEAHKTVQNTLAHLSISKRTIITSQQECSL